MSSIWQRTSSTQAMGFRAGPPGRAKINYVLRKNLGEQQRQRDLIVVGGFRSERSTPSPRAAESYGANDTTFTIW